MQESILVIFSRTPVLGMVKTRIGNKLGEDKALQIHLRLFSRTMEVVKNAGCKTVLYLTERWDDQTLQKYKLQHGSNLGERMLNALRNELEFAARVCIIGTDCLDISKNDIENAFNSLNNADVVIGPAADGGYYLIGMKEPHASLFDEIAWGQSTVLAETIAACSKSGLSFKLLETRHDLDRPEDIPADWR